MALEAVGSSPIIHPIFYIASLGRSQVVRQRSLESPFVGSNPAAPAICFCEPLAQLVEHLTFNQGVAGSSPAWLTILYFYADVAELADALDLGSSGSPRVGSTPTVRTKFSNNKGSSRLVYWN